MGVLSAKKQADLLKDKGNLYFRKEKLGAAIEAYTEAITLCPSVPLYWTNRALCERKRHEWEKVEADCRRALELDRHCVKAYYLLGLALVHYQQYEEAVKQLEKAMDLGRGAEGNYMVEEIWQELAKAKFVEWEAVSEVREREQLDLKMHLSKLLRDDYDRTLEEAIVSIKNATAAKSYGSAGGIQAAPQMEVNDLIRFDSDSRQGSGSKKGEGKKYGLESDKLFPIDTGSELEKLYRSQSEPPSVIQKDDEPDVVTTTFDPLKQHKLSLRRGNSISMRRQKSERSSVSRGESEKLESPAAAARGGEPQTEAAAAPPSEKTLYHDFAREMLQSEERASSTGAHATSVLSAGARESTSKSTSSSDSSEMPQFHSIYDVFKVFKEFMKLHQNEAGQKLLRVSELYQRRSKVLEDVFERAAAPDRQVEIPDHLCCKITMDIYRDPVISTSGITYERAAILEHLRKVGPFDPLTRAPLTAAQIVPNLAVKEAVQAYLDEHGWAYGPC